jgi:hypothetical protein
MHLFVGLLKTPLVVQELSIAFVRPDEQTELLCLPERANR